MEITDFTKWVAIPPLKLFISTLPSSIALRKGDTATIEVRMNSTEGYDPLVSLDAKDPTGNLMANFQSGSNRILVPIPSYGIATIPLTVSTSRDTVIAPHTIVLSANSTFPPDELYGYPGFEQNSANIATHSTMAVLVQEPLSIEDVVSNFWTKLGPALVFATE